MRHGLHEQMPRQPGLLHCGENPFLSKCGITKLGKANLDGY